MLMRSLVLVPVLVLALGTGSAEGRAGAAGTGARRAVRCRVPEGARLVAQDAVARIVVFDTPRVLRNDLDVNREWRYCWRKTGGYHRLVFDGAYNSGLGDVIHVVSVVLAGRWAAWATTTTAFGGRYGSFPVGAVSVRDLGGGPVRVASTGSDVLEQFRGLVLAPTGTAAWQFESMSPVPPNDFYWAVQALNGRSGAGAVLDRSLMGSAVPLSDPFANVRLYACAAGCSAPAGMIVAWQSDGSWRYAPAP